MRQRPATRYQIIRRHARGGLGEISIAVDPELERQVALKELRAFHADDPTSQSRFLLEAEADRPAGASGDRAGIQPGPSCRRAARTTRCGSSRARPSAGDRAVPRTPRVRRARAASASWRSGGCCGSLIDSLQRGRLRPQPRRRAPRPEARKHHARPVRRDVGRRLGDRQDRGERRRADPRRAGLPAATWGMTSLTRPGSAIGTPRYMSPEQAEGDLERVGPASDVYSLGATLYCMLVGHGPFPTGGVADVLATGAARDFPRAAPAAPVDRSGARGDLPEGDGTRAGRSPRHVRWPWPRRSRPGWRTSATGASRNWLSATSSDRWCGCASNARRTCSGERCPARGCSGWGAPSKTFRPDSPDLERVVRTSLAAWHAAGKLVERTLCARGQNHGGRVQPGRPPAGDA